MPEASLQLEAACPAAIWLFHFSQQISKLMGFVLQFQKPLGLQDQNIDYRHLRVPCVLLQVI